MLNITKILCPVDFSAFSLHAFDRAIAIARLCRATVTVLHIIPRYSSQRLVPSLDVLSVEAPEPSPLDREQVNQHLERFLGLDGSEGVAVACEVGAAPDVAWEILAHADRLAADLLVMGTHGRAGFRRLVFGSVTEKVLRSARQPVLHVVELLPPAYNPALGPSLDLAGFQMMLEKTGREELHRHLRVDAPCLQD